MPSDTTADSGQAIPILFTHFGDQWIRGSETLLLDLMGHLDPARFRPVVWCNGTDMADACRAAGHQTHRSDFAFYFDAGSPRFSPRMYAALVREGIALARRHGVRILHANSAAPTQWLLPVARTLRLPLLSHLHIGYLRRARYAMLLHQADLIVGVSSQVLESFIVDGVPAARTRVIYNGIDFARMDRNRAKDLRPRLDIPVGARLIATAGSLIQRKGHDLLIRALGRLTGDPAPHLLIAGEGPERQALQRLAAELSVADRVHFLGHHENMPDVYESCDIFALASRGDAFGLVLAEAGYERRPVVATRVGGIPEVIADGATGLLVPPDDPQALTGALQRLLDDPALRERLGAAGRARAQSQFSVQRMASDFSRAYGHLAARQPTALGWATVAARTLSYARLLAPRRIAG